MAGFGTAGSVLACAAVLFFVAGAVVAFHGWPQIATQTAPATVSIGSASRSSALPVRRLAGLTVTSVGSGKRGATHVVTSRPAPRVGRPGGPSGEVGHGGGGGSGSGSGGGGGLGTPPGGGGGAPTGGGGPPTGGGGPPPGGGGPPAGGGDGPGGETVTVGTPVTPPITVTVPTGGAGTIVTKVTGKIGGPVGKIGQGLGTVLGG